MTRAAVVSALPDIRGTAKTALATQGPPLAQHAERFLTWFQFVRRRSPHTTVGYGHDLSSFLIFAERAGLARPEDVTFEHVELYLGAIQHERGVSPRTANRHLHCLRSFWTWMKRYRLAPDNPPADCFLLPTEKRMPSYLSIPEQEHGLAELSGRRDLLGRRDYALIGTGLLTGLRNGELGRLQLAHLDLEAKILRVIQGKGGRDRELPIVPRLDAILRAYLEETRPKLVNRPFGKVQPPGPGRKYWHVIRTVGRTTRTYSRATSREEAERLQRALIPLPPDSSYVFVHAASQHRGRGQGQPLGSKAIHYLVRAALTPLIGRPVHPHMLRHSFASRLRANGADLQVMQEAMGHASIVTTTMYAHISTPQRLADLARLLE